MQGIFNRQQFITSLFSRGPFASNLVTVCSRRVVTSSRCALHHGKGVTFKIHGERNTGYGHNTHYLRTPQGPSSCKYYKTSSCLKASRSGKSSGSSCRITKSMKGKIVFRVTHQPLPKIIVEEAGEKPSAAFRNSINKVLGYKNSRRYKLNNNSHLAYSKQPVETLSSPQFKEAPTPSVNTGKQKTIKDSPTAKLTRKSQSAETQRFIERAKDGAKNNVKNETGFRTGSEKRSSIEISVKKANGKNLSVCANDKNRLAMNRSVDSKPERDVFDVLSNKKPLKSRTKPLVFSSSEMLFSSTEPSNEAGIDTTRKPENSFNRRDQRKVDKNIVKCKEQKGSTVVENDTIEPLEGSVDSTIKLFMNRNNRSHPVSKESRLSDTLEDIVKLVTDKEILNFGQIGRTPVAVLPKFDKSISDHDLALAKNQFKKVDGDVGKLDGPNRGLGETASGDQGDRLSKAPLKPTEKPTEWNNVIDTPRPTVQTLKKSDNVTLHRHMDLQRQTKEERVEFETTVIEQGGKKITRMTPKIHDSPRRNSSNPSVAVKKTKIHLNNVDRNSKMRKMSNNRLGNTKIETSAQEKSKKVLDKIIIPGDGKKISPVDVDPFVPKVNLQSSRRNADEFVIPADGRIIRDGDCDWCIKRNISDQNRDSGLVSEKVVIPQDGNTIHPWETDTDSHVSRNESLLGKENFTKTPNVVETHKGVKYRVDNGQAGGQLRESKQNRSNLTMVSTSNSMRTSQRVGNVPEHKAAVQSDAVEVNKEPEFAKSSPKMSAKNEVSKQEVAAPHTIKVVADRITSHTTVIDKEVESVRQRETGFSQLTQIKSESSVHKQNEVSNKKNRKHLLPNYNKTSSDTGKILDEKQSLHSSFADSFVTVTEHIGVSSVRDGNSDWKRKVTKMKVVPQNGLESFRVGVSMTSPLLNEGVQPAVRPRTNIISENASAAVLKPRLAQSPPVPVNLASQTQSVTNGLSQVYSNNATTSHSYKPRVSTSTNVGLMSADASNDQESRMRGSRISSMPGSPPSSSTGFSSSMNSGTNPNGGSPSNSSCDMPKVSFPPPCNTCHNKPATAGNQGSGLNSSCDMPKASFPPPCNTCHNKPATAGNQGSGLNSSCDMPKASFPPPCNTCHNKPATAGNQGSGLNSCCDMSNASFPPPRNTCPHKPAMAGNLGSCSADGCNTKSVFPPPSAECETPKEMNQPEQTESLSCPTCKPEFPPPCPSNPCSSTTCRPENSCYDPCKVATKSKTHTIIDVDNLPRPPTPICINCLPKSKPCFPPKCSKQCKTNSSTWCKQMLDTKNEISFAGWRAYMNYTYWSMKCLFTGLIERFLAILRTQIMHLNECKTKKSDKKLCPPQRERNVMQLSLMAHKRAAQVGMSKFNRKHKQVHSMMEHKVKPTSKTKARKKRVVKSVKKPVHDGRSKRAIVAEEEKRKSAGVRANPALAYSEVLNIVFSQKK